MRGRPRPRPGAAGVPAVDGGPAGKARRDVPQGDTTVLRCSFCRGTGKDPFGIMSSISTCSVCRGSGESLVRGPHRRCPHCQGTGAVKTFTCGVCRGTGYLPSPTGPTVRCPECGGTGDDKGAPALSCLMCQGHGLVPA